MTIDKILNKSFDFEYVNTGGLIEADLVLLDEHCNFI